MTALDHTTEHCARCGRYVARRDSYITASYTPPGDRVLGFPNTVVLERQCIACANGQCAATVDHVEAPCSRPRRRGEGTCLPCAQRIERAMKLELWKYGISEGLEKCEIK